MEETSSHTHRKKRMLCGDGAKNREAQTGGKKGIDHGGGEKGEGGN